MIKLQAVYLGTEGLGKRWWRCQPKNTLALPKSLKNSPGFTKLRSQISETKFSVVHDIIGKYYIIDSGLEKTVISVLQKIMTIIF